MRLIDADKLSKSRQYLFDTVKGPFPKSEFFIKMECVHRAKTIDAVPVVRCKNCIHYDMGVCLKIYSDGNVSSDAWQKRNPDDFCSYGERKDKNED